MQGNKATVETATTAFSLRSKRDLVRYLNCEAEDDLIQVQLYDRIGAAWRRLAREASEDVFSVRSRSLVRVSPSRKRTTTVETLKT